MYVCQLSSGAEFLRIIAEGLYEGQLPFLPATQRCQIIEEHHVNDTKCHTPPISPKLYMPFIHS